MADESKQRIIQEYVPGKQVTLAHVIANPDESLYRKIGAVTKNTNAMGILTITPSEAAIIGADIAAKASNIEVVFVDRFSGSLIITGDVASVESAMEAVLDVLGNVLQFSTMPITKS
jgi:ethanolamine utilization protein EutS